MLRAKRFPKVWVSILEKDFRPYRALSFNQRRILHSQMNVFLGEKAFIGKNGLNVTVRMKVLIAAHACLLVLDESKPCYPSLSTIYIYPTSFTERVPHQNRKRIIRLGESWHRGPVVLAWDSVSNGFKNFRDGKNVTFHEFAHQLDQGEGHADGTPELRKIGAYQEWGRVLSRPYLKLRRRAERGKKSVFDHYGAENEAEFFAVATETFFEKPRQLRRSYPELYEVLRNYYGLDPIIFSD